MQSAQEAYHDLIQNTVAPVMKGRGFRKTRQTFWMYGSDIWRVVSFQKSQWNSNDRVSFTADIGVGSQTLMPARPWNKPPIAGPLCAVFVRIGRLLSAPEDKWWKIRTGDDIDRVAGEVVSALEEGAIPFLEQFPDEHALLAYWSDAIEHGWPGSNILPLPDVIKLAAALGDVKLAQDASTMLSAAPWSKQSD